MKRAFKNPQRQDFDEDLQDDIKWWEIPAIFLFLGSLWVLVHVVEWFRNPIRRGLFVSALIGFILSVMLLLFTAMMWSL